MASAGRVLQTNALVLQRTAFGEADWIVSLFTQDLGRVSALARGARKSQRRFAGGLEAFHDLLVQLKSSRSDDLLQLADAKITHPRHRLASNLVAMQTAGKGLNWLRRTLAPKLVDAQAWQLIQRWLDVLDTSPPSKESEAEARLAEFGLKLLSVLGWSLVFDKCVRCNKPCPPNGSAYVSPRDGGVVCRACGGHGPVLTAALRHAMSRASQLGFGELPTDQGASALHIVERALLSHAGVE